MQKQTLSLAQTQRLQMVLAPQLRQSLEMLQLPMLELRTMIQQEIEQNPTIEEVAGEEQTAETDESSRDEDASEELDFDKEFEQLAKLDEEWRDYFFQNRDGGSYGREQEEKRKFMFDSLPQKESLQEHLLQQLNLSGLSESDREIGELIAGNINDDGYLTISVEDLAESAGFDVEKVNDILAVVQDFHPTGVGARDIRECLLLQLERLGKASTLAAEIVKRHLDDLGAHKYQQIARSIKVTPEDVQQAAKLVATLEPKPGRLYSNEDANYVLPEVVVRKVDGKYVVLSNNEYVPHVRISRLYRRLLQNESTKPEVKSYIRERIRSGAFLIKSIQQRLRTIERIAGVIVEKQHGFLEKGLRHLKPLTMAEVAKEVGVHETTVSRAVSGKYMQTPKGVVEMKYFFTPGIRTADGKQVSNKTVKDMIAGLVAAEDPARPLSDQEIMDHLKKKGISIARRTIAKYRLVLRIPPSHMRRTY
ncbi:MAG: RNA polymerase factor sigma-54 [Kiritimatiellia bacterium]